MTNILLGMLGSNGDCLYATAIARQLKLDFPGCHLTWAIGRMSRQVLVNNPDVDTLWEVPQASWADAERSWTLFEAEAHDLANAGRFDHVYLPQISPARFGNYDGTIRPSIFRGFPRSLTVPVDVTIALTEEETAAVDSWVNASPIAGASQVVLCECSSKSGQSFMSLDMAMKIAETITAARQKTVVVISTHEQLRTDNPQIISGGALSIRQNARLTHYADLFLGCGSGLTVAATAGSAKPGLPNIQVLRRGSSVYASFRHDFQYFGKLADHFLEVTREDAGHIAQVALVALADGIAAAQAEHDDPVPLTFDWYMQLISTMLLERGQYVDAARSLLVTLERYGRQQQLQVFGKYRVLPFLADDPRHVLPHRRHEAERLRALMD